MCVVVVVLNDEHVDNMSQTLTLSICRGAAGVIVWGQPTLSIDIGGGWLGCLNELGKNIQTRLFERIVSKQWKINISKIFLFFLFF